MDAGSWVANIIAGVIAGGVFGIAGGFLGGGVDGYFSIVARVIAPSGRMMIAKFTARIGSRVGLVVGLIIGGTTSVMAAYFPPFLLLFAAGMIFRMGARHIVRSEGETIDGLVGAATGGALFGVAGGYAGLFLVSAIRGVL